MPVVRTRSRRVKESPAPDCAELRSEDPVKPRTSRKKKETSGALTVGENPQSPAGRRQPAKRKQQQDDREKDGADAEPKKRRITRKSNAPAEVKEVEPVVPRNSRASKSKVENMDAAPLAVSRSRKSVAEPRPAARAEKKPSLTKEADEVALSGRARRNVRKSSVVLVDFDPDEESETDFSDNDDDDFVLPESEKSDEEEEEAPEEDPEPEVLAPRTKAAPTRAKSKKSRSDKIREFLLDVEKSAPPELCSKREASPPPKKAKEIAAPRKIGVTAKPVRNRSDANKSSVGASRKTLSDDEDEVPVAMSQTKRSRNPKGTPSAGRQKKRTRASSEDSHDSLVAPKKAKSVRTPKVPMKSRKTFTKPKKNAFRKSEDETSQDGSGIDTTSFEKSLLKLAKRMDDKEESQDVDGDEEDNGEETNERAEEKVADEASEEASKSDAEPAQTEAEKKLLILSMLKEHEPVHDMSDGSSDDDDQAKPKARGDSGEGEVKEAADSGGIKSEAESVEVNGDKRSKSGQIKREQRSTEHEKTIKKSEGRKGAAKKEEAIKSERVDESSDSDDENWEVVENAAVRDPNYKRPDNVTVLLQAEDFISDGKKGLTMEQRMIRLINRRRRSVALYSHRVHLLALIAYHRWLNSILGSDHVRAYALSVLPASLAVPGKSQNEAKTIQNVLSFYESNFERLPSDDAFIPRNLKSDLLKLMSRKKTYCNITYLFGLVALLRVCGIRSRLCLSYRLKSHKAIQLRVKDGEMYEVGSKTRSISAETGIDDYFVEVYFSNKKRWRPIDVDTFQVIEDPQDLNPHLEQPVSHLIGIDGKGCMVDLSPKYNADWLNRVKTLRGDPKFFEEVLQRYAPDEKDRVEEQKEVASKHDQQGLPKVISEYKNHPKYALKRHLLKHEAFYPRDPPVLGEIRGEPVYPRENVFLLHSRDQWYRKARSVKEGEEAYNVVTARPKFDRRKEVWVKDLPMEIFGEWQTERFKPPLVVDGKIPRNKYGNVDLFHPDMLPIGAAHVKLPMLNRVAADLGVDCVPAVIGFDGLGRAFHAVFEGYVVCEEHKDMLEKAWHERQHEDRHTRRERIRARAIKNWKMIIKKVFWDLRLKKKYKNNLDQE